jgi:hypothetical protein
MIYLKYSICFVKNRNNMSTRKGSVLVHTRCIKERSNNKSARHYRLRCIASVGTRINGRFTLTSLCLKEPSGALRMTLPAKVRSLSNHVCHSPPPYVCTFTIWCPDLKEADLGLSLRHGLSVWAAIILKPFPTLYLQYKTCRCIQYSNFVSFKGK